MKTLTVRLPESVVAEIDAESRKRKVSKSGIVRERLQESLAMLKILAQSSKSVAKGRVRPLKAALASVRKRIKISGA
jgi:Arc/MetJ-type ribon-helix-helix transcriptional regulator